MEFHKDPEEGYGRVPVKDIMTFLEHDFGKDWVITIRISIINVYIYILNQLFYFMFILIKNSVSNQYFLNNI